MYGCKIVARKLCAFFSGTPCISYSALMLLVCRMLLCVAADVPTDGIHTTEWEREREREEFAQAARLYRPLSAMIASRFTRAKFDDDDAKALLPAESTVSHYAFHIFSFSAGILLFLIYSSLSSLLLLK